MPLIAVPDGELFYREIGHGHPCLAIHGGLGFDHTYFLPNLESLADCFRFVLYDQRGNGRSSRPPSATITIEQLATDANSLRDRLGYSKVALLGHSFGGFVALECALRFPDFVSHLILVGTAAAFDYGAEISAGIMRRNPSTSVLQALSAGSPTTDDDMRTMIHAILPLYFHDYDSRRAEAAFAETKWSASAYARNEVVLPQYDLSSRLNELRIPTLILVGDDDFICPPSQAQRMHAAIVDSELAILNRCGHFPFVERPERLQQVLRAWWHRTNGFDRAAAF